MKPKQMWILGGGAAALAVVAVLASRGEQGQAVQVTKASRQDIVSKVSANGKIQAVKKVDITANVMGPVTQLKVKEGDLVRRGDVLLEIDPVRSRAAAAASEAGLAASSQELENAKARLEQARSDFARAQANRKEGIIAQSEFEQVSTALRTAQGTFAATQKRVDQARAELAGTRDSLRKTLITAPMDGVVTAKRIELGETAVIGLQNQPGTVLVTISDMSKVEAQMEVDEASIPNVRVGQEAQIRIDAYPNQVFQGVVTEVGGSPIVALSAAEAIKFRVKVELKNPPATIKPGLSNQADIFTGSRPQALAVPIQALVVKPVKAKADAKNEAKAETGAPKEEEGVFLMENGKAVFRAVKTGLLGDLNVEVTEGLQGGETIISGPFKALRELKGGEAVRVEKKKAKSKGAKKDE